jgi:receptor protein-tyrosine kinase
MNEVIEQARSRFDFVIVDCPPVLGLADCLAVLPLTDIVLLVVKSGKTRGGAIQEVGDRLARVGVSVDAVILNDFRVARGRPGHHAYGYYRASPEYFRSERAERRAGRQAASGLGGAADATAKAGGRLPQPSAPPSGTPGSEPLAGPPPKPNGEIGVAEPDPSVVPTAPSSPPSS